MKKNIKNFSRKSRTDMFINYLWFDKKRHFGLPLSFTSYALSKDRLFQDRGFIFSHHNEILLYRIRDISVTISLLDRLFGVGTVRIYSADTSSPVMSLINVKHPMVVKELIHCYVETTKEDKGYHISEFMGSSM